MFVQSSDFLEWLREIVFGLSFLQRFVSRGFLEFDCVPGFGPILIVLSVSELGLELVFERKD